MIQTIHNPHCTLKNHEATSGVPRSPLRSLRLWIRAGGIGIFVVVVSFFSIFVDPSNG
jgi:hypothetical protein